MEKRFLVLSAKELAFSTTGNEVLIHLQLADASAALVPELEFALRLSPDEARQFAQTLDRKADEAEA
jgi:hypothetical protein